MRKQIITAVLVVAATLTASFADAQCGNYHERRCEPSENEMFMINSQSRSALFAKGSKSTLYFVSHAGHDYRVSFCIDDKLGAGAEFKVFAGRESELIYDNTEDELMQDFIFTATSTKRISLEIKIPGTPEEEELVKRKKVLPKNMGCVGVLIEEMLTPKMGF